VEEDYRALAAQQLERFKALCDQLQLQYVDLGAQLLGVGIAVGFGQTDYVVASIMATQENKLLITSGILNHIKQDRMTALEAANHFTMSNTLYPVFVHDAGAGGSALLLQQTHPIELLIEAPDYLDVSIRGVPQIASKYRTTIAERWDLGGRPWAWNEEDIWALLTRRMT
jgi:hypothetical protein